MTSGGSVRLRCAGLAVQLTVLAVAVLIVYAVQAPVTGWLGGRAGLLAAGVAGAICLLGAALALVVSRLLRETNWGPYGPWLGLLAMLPRMGIPLVLGLALQVRGGALAESRLLVYLVVFYPVTLGLGTAFAIPVAGKPSPPRGGCIVGS